MRQNSRINFLNKAYLKTKLHCKQVWINPQRNYSDDDKYRHNIVSQRYFLGSFEGAFLEEKHRDNQS